jgi:hypothetical protein
MIENVVGTGQNSKPLRENCKLRPNYAIQISTLPDERLEALVSDWLGHRTKHYHARERWSGPGDLGRDVVGYVSALRHEGEWDNFQCKQLSTRLSETSAFIELGKIFMHSANGEYRLPRAYYFVAPQGIVRKIKALIAHPERFRRSFLDRWDAEIASGLVENATVPLSDAIRVAINAFDFTELYALDSLGLADDPAMLPVLVQWFGADPGPPPCGVVPDGIDAAEATYLSQLVTLYGERAKLPFSGPHDVLQHPDWGQHLRDQRTRYFEAAAFDRYYRDSTPPEYLIAFRKDVYHGVVDVYREDHRDGLERVNKVMGQAAAVSAFGVLGKHAGPAVKQGTCHHFANEGKMPWKP